MWQGIIRLPAFLRDLASFTRQYSGPMEYMPCLHDRSMTAGATESEYFWQDLLVARWIREARPRRHVDVGSRLDGFVAHVASYRQIEVFDIRPLPVSIPGVTFTQHDLMGDTVESRLAMCDSLSCLHALEHFGLGRYGDPVKARGLETGLRNLAAMLEPGGTLYLAVPVGRQRVLFNANWIFAPHTILECARGLGLELVRFASFQDGSLQEHEHTEAGISSVTGVDYALGIFRFAKAVA